MTALRMTRVVLHLCAGLFTCAVVFPFSSVQTHEKFVRRWSRQLLAICRVEVVFHDRSLGEFAEPALVISNHVSWLDIFVMNSLQPCYFVAKADIRGWPLLGWLCEKAGTIFLARGKQREVRRIYANLVQQIVAGQRVAFFPEGTTAAQGNLLAFHANLFEAAIEAKVPVQPYAVRYLDRHGNYHPAADFIGDMTFIESMLNIFKTEPMKAELIRLPSLATTDAHRRDVALAARQIIAQGLEA